MGENSEDTGLGLPGASCSEAKAVCLKVKHQAGQAAAWPETCNC